MAKIKRTKGQEEFEDTKGVIRICKSRKNRQHNGQNKKNKKTNNDLQNITQKTKDKTIVNNPSIHVNYQSELYHKALHSTFPQCNDCFMRIIPVTNSGLTGVETTLLII
jgi:hypothetical protein